MEAVKAWPDFLVEPTADRDPKTLADAADRSTLRARALLAAALLAGIAALSLLVSWSDIARAL